MRKRSLWRFLVSQVFNAHGLSIYLHFGGSDVLWLYHYPPGYSKFEIQRYRWYIHQWMKLTNVWYTINSERLRPYLVEEGIPAGRIIHWETPWTPVRAERVKHAVFNVLFYLPHERYGRPKYIDWLYGREFLDELRWLLPDVNFIVAHGKLNMRYIYSITDCYVKINRMPHQDMNRIGKECMHLGIPVRAFNVYEGKTAKDMALWINTKRGI